MPQTTHYDVVIVGAGISGVGAARALAGSGHSVTIIEERSRVGGTWDLFRYPGVRSDSDMSTFGYASRPWTDDRSLAPGADIREYVEEAAAEAGVLSSIEFGQRVRRADWSSDTDRWTIEREDVATGAVSTVTGRMLFAATGYYRYDQGFTPSWPTLDAFEGEVVHPQHWPESIDVEGKDVVVVGSGATAVTLVPALAEAGARVRMLQRSPTFVAAVPRVDRTGVRLRAILPGRVAGTVNRWRSILRGMLVYEYSRRRPASMRRMLRAGVVRHLGATFPVDEHFDPRYDPWDQRLCAAPGGDFFRSIASGRAEVVTDEIAAFASDGIELRSGRHLPADVVVTATGLDVRFLGGMQLRVDGEIVDPATRVSYRGMMLDGVPNLAFAIGYTNASWTMKIDLVTDYLTRVIAEMDRRDATRVTPRYRGARDELRPLIDLASGYVRRGQHMLPRQGATGAWRMHQSYLTDRVLFRGGTERDRELEYDAPGARPGAARR